MPLDSADDRIATFIDIQYTGPKLREDNKWLKEKVPIFWKAQETGHTIKGVANTLALNAIEDKLVSVGDVFANEYFHRFWYEAVREACHYIDLNDGCRACVADTSDLRRTLWYNKQCLRNHPDGPKIIAIYCGPKKSANHQISEEAAINLLRWARGVWGNEEVDKAVRIAARV